MLNYEGAKERRGSFHRLHAIGCLVVDKVIADRACVPFL